MKKKVTLLAALAMAVTIGGVYATWNYTQGAATSTASTELTMKIAGNTISNSSIGTLAVKGVGGFMLDDTNNDHKAEVVFEGSESAYFYVTFTDMAVGVDTSKIQIQYTITLSGVVSKDGTEEILSYDQQGGILTYADFITEEDLSNTATLDQKIAEKKKTFILERFKWKNDQPVELPTYAEYKAYHDLLATKTPKITITLTDISDYTQNTQN